MIKGVYEGEEVVQFTFSVLPDNEDTSTYPTHSFGCNVALLSASLSKHTMNRLAITDDRDGARVVIEVSQPFVCKVFLYMGNMCFSDKVLLGLYSRIGGNICPNPYCFLAKIISI